jgi:hypothetical protein
MGANKRLGRWLRYGLCRAPAVIMLGYYWLDDIPVECEYFMNLRFRSLSMIGDRLRTRSQVWPRRSKKPLIRRLRTNSSGTKSGRWFPT